MKKLSVAILSACLLLSSVSAVSADPAGGTHQHKVHEKHVKKEHAKKIRAKSTHKVKAKSHAGKMKTKSIKAKQLMPKSGFGGASEQTE